MKPKIETKKGWTEVIIDNNSGYEKFYKVAGIIKNGFNLKFTEKLDGVDTHYWDFVYQKSMLVLFYNIYEGTSIFPKAFNDSTKIDNDNSKEFGEMLFLSLINLDWSNFENGKTIGLKGSENGKIRQDFESVNGARITLEEDCGNIPFSITVGIYGLLFHTHFESELHKSTEYILETKLRINKVFDLYDIQEDERDEYWERKHITLINKITGIENIENHNLVKVLPKRGVIAKLKDWFT